MGAEVITHLQVLSLLPGTSGPHAISRTRQSRHASAGFLSIDRFLCGGGDMRKALLRDVERRRSPFSELTRLRRPAEGDNVACGTGHPTWAEGNNCSII